MEACCQIEESFQDTIDYNFSSYFKGAAYRVVGINPVMGKLFGERELKRDKTNTVHSTNGKIIQVREH